MLSLERDSIFAITSKNESASSLLGPYKLVSVYLSSPNVISKIIYRPYIGISASTFFLNNMQTMLSTLFLHA